MRRQPIWLVALLAVASPAILPAQAPAGMSLISIVLEQRTGSADHWVVQTVDPAHVFAAGDTVRFRLKPSVDGFLYVMDLNTSGKYVVLFPHAETGNDNRIEHGHEYPIGWFDVSGPAGYEKLYFLVSPVALSISQVQNHAANMPPQGTAPATMKPRCNDEVFKARGECIDAGAGPKAVAPGETLPRDLTDLAGTTSRDLRFTSDSSGTTVSSANPLSGPVVYEFLLAHK